MPTYKVTTQAYCKVVLHAAKYPSSHIGGYLLGNVGEDEKITISDTFPICHGYPVGPIFEVAGATADTANESKDGIKIIGYYHASEDTSCETLPYIAKVLETIQKESGTAIAIVLNADMIKSKNSLCLQAFKEDEMLDLAGDGSPASMNAAVDEILTAANVQTFCDFEGHMDSPQGAGDFRNGYVSKALDAWMDSLAH
jgi:hypothetical protein